MEELGTGCVALRLRVGPPCSLEVRDDVRCDLVRDAAYLGQRFLRCLSEVVDGPEARFTEGPRLRGADTLDGEQLCEDGRLLLPGGLHTCDLALRVLVARLDSDGLLVRLQRVVLAPHLAQHVPLGDPRV